MENIIKTFALYLGYEIQTGTFKTALDTHYLNKVAQTDGWAVKSKLILRPLSDITDEEAIEVANMAVVEVDWEWEIDRECLADVVILTHGSRQVWIWNDGDVIVDFNMATINTANNHLITDYLRSRGFDIPCFWLGGKTPSQAGIAILRDIKSNQNK